VALGSGAQETIAVARCQKEPSVTPLGDLLIEMTGNETYRKQLFDKFSRNFLRDY